MTSIQFLGHASVKIETPGHVILIDPWVSGPTWPKGVTVETVNALLLTHAHFDHISDVVDLVKNHPECTAFVMFDIGEMLKEKGVNEEQIVGLNKGGTVEIGGGCRASMVHAVHSGVHDAGWVVHLPNGHRVYHSGDTDVFGDMELISKLYDPDVACLCIGGHFTMGPSAAAYALDNLLKSVNIVIPIHYGTFPALAGTPAELQSHLKRKEVNVCKLSPGESLELTGRSVDHVFKGLI